MTIPEKTPIVTEPSEAFLNPRQVIDYRSEREDCLEWLLAFGKKPDKAEGYAVVTVDTRSRRMDQFYRWVWQEEGGYTANVTHDHADGWMRELAQADYSSTHKSNCQKSIQMLFKWIAHERGGSKWDPDITFTDSDASSPRDYLTRFFFKVLFLKSGFYGTIRGRSHTPQRRSCLRCVTNGRYGAPSSVSPTKEPDTVRFVLAE